MLVSAMQQSDSVIDIYIYICVFFSIVVFDRILNIVPCAIVPCCLSMLYIVVCICSSHTPNLSLLYPLSSLVTIGLSSRVSESVSVL